MLAEEVVVILPTFTQIINALPCSDKTSLKCQFCNRTFHNRNAKQLHLVKTHRHNSKNWYNLNAQLGVLKNDVSKNLHFFCPSSECGKKWYSSSKLLIQHFQKMHTEKCFKCEHCTMRFSLLRDLNYHVKKKCSVAQKNNQSTNEGKFNNKSTKQINVLPKRSMNKNNGTNGTKFFLLPIVFNYKFIKIQPKRAVSTVGTQTSNNTLFLLHGQNNYNLCLKNVLYPNLVDATSQVNFVPVNHSTFSQSEVDNESLSYRTNLPAVQYVDRGCGEGGEHLNFSSNESVNQNLSNSTTDIYVYHQDSFSQTVYPETVDFGTQYCHNNNNFAVSNSLYLSMTSNHERMVHSSAGSDFSEILYEYVEPERNYVCNKDQYVQENRSSTQTSYWRHMETQTCFAPEKNSF